MSAAEKEVKCLCVGDVNGNFELLTKKIALINKNNGPFDSCFVVGEFFGPNKEENEKAINGDYVFPLSTYVLGPCCPSTAAFYPDESVEFSPSLTFLGRRGILYTASGMSVGYMSGIYGPTANAFQFTDDDVDDLLLPIRTQAGFLGVDILLTSQWPSDVAKHSMNQPTTDVVGSKALSRLAAGLKPRYHFAGMGGHYERSPYRNHRVLLEAAQHVTRFIGLAAVGNKKKEKWVYAFTLKPMKKIKRAELTTQPGNTTEFPYMDVLTEYVKSQMERNTEKQQSQQFFFDEANYSEEESEETEDRSSRRRRGGDYGDGPQHKKFAQQIATDQCWFCLSNADAEKHLVVSVGANCYMAMPKGPLTSDHVMILSIGHVQSLVSATEETREEVNKYKDAYSLMCHKNGKVVCVFERNFKTSHLQIQLVPVPLEKGSMLRSAFCEMADKLGIELCFMNDEENIWDMVNEGSPYFYAELPDGSKLFCRTPNSFPIQFGREVVAMPSILNCREKVDWKKCVLGKEKETETTQTLKQSFKTFDFNADSDSDDD